MPLSRASAISSVAPASRSPAISATQSAATTSAFGFFEPHSESTVKSRASIRISARLRLDVHPERAVGHLDVPDAEALQPPHVVGDPALVLADLEEGAARGEVDARRVAQPHLGLDAVRDVGRAPAELHDVDGLARRLDQRLEREQRQALVQHVGEAVGAWLGGAVGEAEEPWSDLSHPFRLPSSAVRSMRPRRRPRARPARSNSLCVLVLQAPSANSPWRIVGLTVMRRTTRRG